MVVVSTPNIPIRSTNSSQPIGSSELRPRCLGRESYKANYLQQICGVSKLYGTLIKMYTSAQR